MWYCFVDFECLDCGHKFTQSEDTLTMATGIYGVCEKCGSENTRRCEKDNLSDNVKGFIAELDNKFK